MAFLGLCSDPLISTLRDVFGANIVRVPEERIKPLCVVAAKGRAATFRGNITPLIVDPAGLNFIPDDISSSRMADVSGKRSRRVDLELGLQILEGFLQGFGVPTAQVSVHLQGAMEVSFSFNNVKRSYVDTNWLGQRLTDKSIDKRNPAAKIFFDENYNLLVIDSVITSSDFSINVERSYDQNFKIDVPSIQSIVAQAKTNVSVSTSSGYDLIFQGRKSLAFAFSCVRLYLDSTGRIASMPPEPNSIEMRGFSTSNLSGLAGLLYSPDRVLLSETPGMLSWE